jgi:methyl coenzyme M reductase subunit C
VAQVEIHLAGLVAVAVEPGLFTVLEALVALTLPLQDRALVAVGLVVLVGKLLPALAPAAVAAVFLQEETETLLEMQELAAAAAALPELA